MFSEDEEEEERKKSFPDFLLRDELNPLLINDRRPIYRVQKLWNYKHLNFQILVHILFWQISIHLIVYQNYF